MTVQQKQTQVFFERFASDWESRSKNKKIELRNTVQQRNNYVLNFIKKNKPLYNTDKKYLEKKINSKIIIVEKKKIIKKESET